MASEPPFERTNNSPEAVCPPCPLAPNRFLECRARRATRRVVPGCARLHPLPAPGLAAETAKSSSRSAKYSRLASFLGYGSGIISQNSEAHPDIDAFCAIRHCLRLIASARALVFGRLSSGGPNISRQATPRVKRHAPLVLLWRALATRSISSLGLVKISPAQTDHGGA